MNKGIQFAFLTAFISGFSIFASKFFIADIDPVLFTLLKNACVAIILSIIVFVAYKQKIMSLSRSQWIRLVSIGIIGGSIPFALFFIGLSKVTALEGAIIHKTLFIWVALMSVIFLKDKLNKFQMLGYIMVTSGALFLGGFSFKALGTGHIFIFLATILWSIEFIIAKKILKNIPSSVVAWARMFFGVWILLGITVYRGSFREISSLNFSQILAILSGAVFLLGYVLTWYSALSQKRASTVSLVLSSSPIITGVLSAIFITHTFPQSNVLSWTLIVIGIIVTLAFNKRKEALSI